MSFAYGIGAQSLQAMRENLSNILKLDIPKFPGTLGKKSLFAYQGQMQFFYGSANFRAKFIREIAGNKTTQRQRTPA